VGQFVNNSEDAFVIDGKNYKKDRFYVCFLVGFATLWDVATIFITWLDIKDHNPFFHVWLVFGFIGAILSTSSILRINGKEIIRVKPDGVEIEYAGFIRKRLFIDKYDLDSVTFEKYVFGPDSFGETGQEGVWSLNLIRKTGWINKRIMLAAFVHRDEKYKIFTDLVSLLEKNNFVFKQKNMLS
jgi:hypothetical protein